MRDSDGAIILNKNNAFEFHFTEQDRKETDEMYKRMVEMKRIGMTQEEILCEILMGSAKSPMPTIFKQMNEGGGL